MGMAARTYKGEQGVQNSGGYAKNRIYICVDSEQPYAFFGRVYHSGMEEIMQFSGVDQLLLHMDDMLNRVNYPSASTKSRYFITPAYIAANKSKSLEDKGDILMENNKEKGKKATFMVQIQYRQNATWQGTVNWMEKNEERSFRSALELIKLIDNATEEADI